MRQILLFILFIIFISCAEKQTFIRESVQEKDYFVIWAHSDIQPRDIRERDYYATAIDDINANVRNVNIALVAGDIIHWTESAEVYQWYADMKSRSYIKHWYEIAGNHDQKDSENYKKIIKMPLHYSVRAGNILILLMSDESRSPETNISDSAFQWWRQMVIDNQDKIIITVTHAYLKQSGLFSAFIDSRDISGSERFADVLREYKVDIWLCGHVHMAQWMNSRVKVSKELNGTLFINVSAIRGNMFKDVESSILFFKNNSDKVLVRSRDHTAGKYEELQDIWHSLNNKFIWDGSEPVMEAM